MVRALKIYDGLSPRELAFVRSCVTQCDDGHVSLTEAYRAAGYKLEGSKPATIRRNAFRTYQRPHVQAKIREMMQHRMATELHTRDYVIGNLMHVANACVSAGDAQIAEYEPGSDAPAPSAAFYTAAGRMLELLGKACGGGMFTERSVREVEPSPSLKELQDSIRSTVDELHTKHGVPLKLLPQLPNKLN